MVPEKKLMDQAIETLKLEGAKSVQLAKETILHQNIDYLPLKEATVYFIENWNDVFHPALVALACAAVGGEPSATIMVGAALVLLAGGADVHDDVIDESAVKEPLQTVFGKFGKDIAILVGDSLILKGSQLLHEACELLDEAKKTAILQTVNDAFFEISAAEAQEASMRGRIDVPENEYMEIIRHKVAAGEASGRIGAIIGGGLPEEVETLGGYGRTLGVLMLIRDEFVDMFERDELANRIEKECLPLPILAALADDSAKTTLLKLLMEGELTEEKIEKVLDLVMSSGSTALLLSDMKRMANDISEKVRTLQYKGKTLESFVQATLEDL